MQPLRTLLLLALLVLNAFAVFEVLEAGAADRAPTPAADVATHPRAVVVGLDGIDVRWLGRYLEEDAKRPEAERRLRNFAKLRTMGGLHALRSEIPPESPVAWASVLTGVNPARHGIYDFVRPGAGYRPVNGMVWVRRLRLLGGRIPFRPVLARSRLAAPTFLERVAAAGYPVVALRQPALFPAKNVPGAKLLSGLGTPDLAGSSGFYCVWSSRGGFPSGDTVFGGVQTPLDPEETTRWESRLPGPPDPSLPRGRRGTIQRASAPVVFERVEGRGPSAVRIQIAGREELLTVGERTPFMVVPFTLGTIPAITVKGHVRFELKRIDPLVVLADPVNIYAPTALLPLTTPKDWARDLWERYGPFETTGWTEQTMALNDGYQDDEGFLRDLEDDMNRSAGMLLGELERGGSCVFQVFTPPDRCHHCFYRYYDPESPGYVEGRMEKLGDPVLRLYAHCDEILGDVMAKLGKDDLLLVCSDHGFESFRWGVNLNEWLVNEGYMVLAGNVVEQNLSNFFHDGDLGADAVDWSKTRAYAMGLGQIYLNLRGREEQGIVDPDDALTLAREIREKLLTLQNPLRPGEKPIVNIYLLDEVYEGPLLDEAPELQVGFGSGYRVSWQTALLGGMGKPVFEPNVRAWSGDHCSNDVSAVPGILLSNRPLPKAADGKPYTVRDIAPTVCDWFDLDVSDFDGTPLPLR